MTLSIVAAISSNNALGYKNELLFEIKDDLKRFQNLTKGNYVLMGRKTFDSIIQRNSKPLSGRTNVLITSDLNYQPKFNELVVHDIDSVIKGYKTFTADDKKIFIIGGETLYRQLLPYTSEIFLTHIDAHVEKADTFYPMELQEQIGFIKAESEEYYSDKYDCTYTFTRYVKPTQLESGDE